jgi:hypothetical protein
MRQNSSLVNSDKNSEYFTWRPVYIEDNISLRFYQNEKRFGQICTENQNTHFMFYNVFPKIVQFMW